MPDSALVAGDTLSSEKGIIELVASIATALGETDDAPLAQIGRIVARCGPEQAQARLAATYAFKANGGKLLPDKSRLRTPGGVFFKLVRQAVSWKDKFGLNPFYGSPASRVKRLASV